MDKETQQQLLELVRRNYEEIAEEFDATRQKPLWPELVKFAAEVPDGASVLDVGCGNGRLASAFVDKKISYLGIDSSIKLIETCKNKFEADNFQFPISNFQFKAGDILELGKVIEDKFDFIFCIAVLHHLPGNNLRLRAFEQMKNRLKPGGKIVLTVWNLWSQPKFLKLILKFGWQKILKRNRMDFGDILFDWGAGKSRRYYHAFTKCGLKQLIAKADLEIERFNKDKFNYYLIIKNRPASRHLAE